MNYLQLVPYNESMTLGQGYNSFLQLPRVHSAVIVASQEPNASRSGDPVSAPASNDSTVNNVQKASKSNRVSQVVSYSSRLVSKLSEVARTMNITSGASVRAGVITVSSNQSTIDEAKFSEADINAVISIKVSILSLASYPIDNYFA